MWWLTFIRGFRTRGCFVFFFCATHINKTDVSTFIVDGIYYENNSVIIERDYEIFMPKEQWTSIDVIEDTGLVESVD